jgi:hypothetical protein
MSRQHSWILAAAAIVALLLAGLPNVLAGPARHVTLSHPARMAGDMQFFYGSGPAFEGPFSLAGGRYEVDLWAQYNSITADASNSGECIFGAYIDGIETPIHLTLSVPVSIGDFVPFHYTPMVAFPAGHYKLVVLPGTDCDWRVSILRLGSAGPAIAITSLGIYLHRGNTFTPITVVHAGQTIDFSVFYRLAGNPIGTPSGRVAFSEHGKAIASYGLRPWTDAHGTKQLYINIKFGKVNAHAPQTVVATFTVTVGSLRASQSMSFTLAR